ncbi:uncharacterized protein LOC117652289 [Thrips palmi]|uniref:Uncharacterized protein LOC117652289 n=1 Tax=Thrips palmi TaxID=161013 RepID=A0A6P9A9Z3_THRPL|nr:uncharacterized protein LOC117652289 [Thrips palmi]XP_034252977.1 uncharacterized protein LOC117652289 [Thrips palmi]
MVNHHQLSVAFQIKGSSSRPKPQQRQPSASTLKSGPKFVRAQTSIGEAAPLPPVTAEAVDFPAKEIATSLCADKEPNITKVNSEIINSEHSLNTARRVLFSKDTDKELGLKLVQAQTSIGEAAPLPPSAETVDFPAKEIETSLSADKEPNITSASIPTGEIVAQPLTVFVKAASATIPTTQDAAPLLPVNAEAVDFPAKEIKTSVSADKEPKTITSASIPTGEIVAQPLLVCSKAANATIPTRQDAAPLLPKSAEAVDFPAKEIATSGSAHKEPKTITSASIPTGEIVAQPILVCFKDASATIPTRQDAAPLLPVSAEAVDFPAKEIETSVSAHKEPKTITSASIPTGEIVAQPILVCFKDASATIPTRQDAAPLLPVSAEAVDFPAKEIETSVSAHKEPKTITSASIPTGEIVAQPILVCFKDASATIPTRQDAAPLLPVSAEAVDFPAKEIETSVSAHKEPNMIKENSKIVNFEQSLNTARRVLFSKDTDKELDSDVSSSFNLLNETDEFIAKEGDVADFILPVIVLPPSTLEDGTEHEVLWEEPRDSPEKADASDFNSPTVDDSESNAAESSFVTPPPGPRKRKSRSGGSSGSPKRKRSTNEHLWKSNVRKTLKNSGQAYTSSKGKEIPEVQMRGPCACQMDCRHRLKEEQRHQVFKKFWALGKHERQWEFIRLNSTSKATKPRRAGQILKRSVSRVYHFTINGEQVPICKQMFMRTLAISDSWITSAYTHLNPEKGNTVSPDKRGGYKKPKDGLLNNIKVNSVKEHINLFPRVPSHYCRKRTKREYLEKGLSIEKMARLYKTWAVEKDIPTNCIASSRQYRDILNANFNIGFYKPKKDQCGFCSIMKNKGNTRQLREKRKDEWAAHIKNKKKARALKTKDIEESLTDKKVVACSFDLQKQLSCPKSEDGEFYYKTKLKVYNFTVFNMTERLGDNFLWHEGIGKKGSSEISSALLIYIKRLVQKGYSDVRFWSDNCGGQNKNRFLFAMYLYAAVKYGIKITHRYLETGHTQMEADSIHARIEKVTDKEDIYDFDTWVEWIESAKEELPMYTVHKLTKGKIFSFASLVDKQNWDKDLTRKAVTWKKVREFHVNGQEGNLVRLKYDFDAESYVTLSPNKQGHPVNLKSFEPPRAYESRIPLSATTIAHLTWLCDKNYVPIQKQGFLRDVLADVEPVEEEVVSDIDYDTAEDEPDDPCQENEPDPQQGEQESSEEEDGNLDG